MKQRTWLAVNLVVVLSFLLACAQPSPTAAPTKPAAPAVATTAPAPPAAATSAPPVATKPAAAAPTAAPVAKIKRGGTITVAIQNDWMTQDPLYTTVDPPSFAMIFEPLVYYRPDAQGKWGPVPALATEWELKDKTATFKLRRGVKFHDGTEWNAKAAKANIDRMIKDPKSLNTDLKDAADSADIIDDYTFKINLKFPYAPLLSVLAEVDSQFSYIVSPTHLEKNGPEAHVRNPVGTGPFQFGEWKSGDRLTVKKFPEYWQTGADGQKLPYLDSIVYRWISDDSVRMLELRSGNIQFTELIQGKDIPSIKSNPELVFVDGPWCGNNYRLAFNALQPPFNTNQKLRQAAQYAMDKQNISTVLGMGTGMPSKYLVLPSSPAYDESVPYYSLDKNKATQLMKDAGFSNGIDVVLDVISRELDKRQAEMLKQMWDGIGLRTELLVSERVAWTRRAQEAMLHQVTTMRNPSRADPGSEVVRYFSGKIPTSYHKYENPEMEKCLVDVNSIYDEAKRRELFKKCQTIAHEDAFEGYIWAQTWNWVYRKELKDPGPFFTTKLWDFRQAWLDK
jgi:peptide/nickel transport system substrate-binding protein